VLDGGAPQRRKLFVNRFTTLRARGRTLFCPPQREVAVALRRLLGRPRAYFIARRIVRGGAAETFRQTVCDTLRARDRPAPPCPRWRGKKKGVLYPLRHLPGGLAFRRYAAAPASGNSLASSDPVDPGGGPGIHPGRRADQVFGRHYQANGSRATDFLRLIRQLSVCLFHRYTQLDARYINNR